MSKKNTDFGVDLPREMIEQLVSNPGQTISHSLSKGSDAEVHTPRAHMPLQGAYRDIRPNVKGNTNSVVSGPSPSLPKRLADGAHRAAEDEAQRLQDREEQLQLVDPTNLATRISTLERLVRKLDKSLRTAEAEIKSLKEGTACDQ